MPAESALSLVERLRAALDRAEEIAHAATAGDWVARAEYPYLVRQNGVDMISTNLAGNDEADAAFIAAFDPAHVLRTVAAHRKILDRHAECGSWIGVCDDRGGGDPEAYKAGGPGCAEIEDDLASIYFPEAPDA